MNLRWRATGGDLSTFDHSCGSARASSIRIFVLAALADSGPMHGHPLRLLADEEHVSELADLTVGGLYGATKRLAVESLIEEVRRSLSRTGLTEEEIACERWPT